MEGDPPLTARWGLEEPAVLGGVLAAYGECTMQIRIHLHHCATRCDKQQRRVFLHFLRRKGGFKSWHHFYVSMFPPYTSLHCTSFKLPGQTPRAKVCQSTLHEFQGKVRRLPCSPSRTSSLCVVTGRHWGSLLPCRKKESIAWILLD